MRALLDVNVIVSGLLSARGAPAEILTALNEGRFESVTSAMHMDELTRVLAYPKIRSRISEADASMALGWFADRSRTCPDPNGAKFVVSSPDSDDDFLIALAASERAALVSGDSDLLGLVGTIPVYSPRAFIELLDGSWAE